ncbi:ester cyclase [Pseudovibrio sp. WM33]|uniref:ester cyclase n=1 Tax=Pseudovibrio sp. WM33 TaxID=1735585 RepID=UPI0007AE9DFC|nr:ester cyclase [Pseudovibrio sp. WM33]KZL20007.1 SnoaL-like polyketide cyclase [Pseudovibrio sp. WM33]
MISTLKTVIAATAAFIFTTAVVAEDMSTNKETLMNFYLAIGEGQVDALDKVLIEDWVTHDAAPGQEQGREAFKQAIPMFTASFSDWTWAVEEMIEEGNVIVARSTFSGVHSGDMIGHAATGKSFTAKAIDVHHFNDEGMVTHTYHLEDWPSVMAQLGLE